MPTNQNSVNRTGNSTETVEQYLRRRLSRGDWTTGAKLPSIRQLAQKLGVSPATAHLAVARLSAEGWVEVRPRSGLYAARPAAIAKTPQSSPLELPPATTIGVSVMHQENADGGSQVESWAGRIVDASRRALHDSRIDLLMLAHWDNEPECTARLNERIEKFGEALGGIVVFQPHSLEPIRDALERRNIPWVVIDRPLNGEPHNYVTADNVALGRYAGRLLAALNARRLLVIGNDNKIFPSGAEKVGGMLAGFVEEGGTLEHVHQVSRAIGSADMGRKVAGEYIKQHGPPDAVFTTGDHLAHGATLACRDAGLDVPGDVSVIGTTGLDAARRFDIPLTTTLQPMDEMGRTAVDMLIEMANTGVRRLPGRILPGKFVIRDSTAVNDRVIELFTGDPSVVWERTGAQTPTD